MSNTVCHIHIKGRPLCKYGMSYMCQYSSIEEAADAVLEMRALGIKGLSILEGECKAQYEGEDDQV